MWRLIRAGLDLHRDVDKRDTPRRRLHIWPVENLRSDSHIRSFCTPTVLNTYNELAGWLVPRGNYRKEQGVIFCLKFTM